MPTILTIVGERSPMAYCSTGMCFGAGCDWIVDPNCPACNRKPEEVKPQNTRPCPHGIEMWENSCHICRKIYLGLEDEWKSFREPDPPSPTPSEKKMKVLDEIFQMAVAAGCDPQWYDGILGWRWHCGCENNIHGCDSQCSAMTKYSITHPEYNWSRNS
jgi:hypothetical protein